MQSETGYFALQLAFVIALTGVAVSLAGVRRDNTILMDYGASAALGVIGFALLAAFCLGGAEIAVAALPTLPFAATRTGLAFSPAARAKAFAAASGLSAIVIAALLMAGPEKPLAPNTDFATTDLETFVRAPGAGSAATASRGTPALAIPETLDLPPLRVGDKGIAVSDLKGRVTLLNVFASWCPVCKIEHPTLMQLAKEAKLPILGVNWKDKPGEGAKWLSANGSPYTQIGEDASGAAAQRFGVTGVPETYLIDAKGRIRHRIEGPLSGDIWRKDFLPLIEAIANEN